MQNSNPVDQALFENYQTVKTYIHNWSTASFEDLQFERLGGLSNEMWKVVNMKKDIKPQAVILRKFGMNEGLIDREKENKVLTTLSEQGVGAKIYAAAEDLRIEKYYPSRTLLPSEVSKESVRRELAMRVAAFHKARIETLDKTPMFLRFLEDKAYIKRAEEKAARDVYTPEERRLLDDIFTLASDEEISFLKKRLPKSPESVVFSHNDLHSMNVLVLDQDESLMLIDFEYSDYNYRGYDIANLFNEAMFEYHTPTYPHYTLDENKYPSEEDLRDIIKTYVFFHKFSFEEEKAQEFLQDKQLMDKYILTHDNMDKILDELEEIFEEVKICRLLSHFYWIMWAVIFSVGTHNINFGYLEYAHKRFQLYHKLKKELFSKRLSRANSRLSN